MNVKDWKQMLKMVAALALGALTTWLCQRYGVCQ